MKRSKREGLVTKSTRIDKILDLCSREFESLEIKARTLGLIGENEKLFLMLRNKTVTSYNSSKILEVDEMRTFLTNTINSNLAAFRALYVGRLEFIRDNCHQKIAWWYEPERDDIRKFIPRLQSIFSKVGVKARVGIWHKSVIDDSPDYTGLVIELGEVKRVYD